MDSKGLESEIRQRNPTKTSPSPDLCEKVGTPLIKGVDSNGKRDVKVVESWKEAQWWSKSVFIFFTVMGFITRFYNIDHPNEVVFDEVHFGKFSSYYLRREYFFDVHPPLAKLILALGGYFIGFKGNFDFETIGLKYADYGVPYTGLRATSAVFGALNVPIVFLILQESGYSLVPSALATCFVLFDNSLITQSRLILLDSQLAFFATLSIYCYIRFHKQRFNEFTEGWWFWLLSTGVSLALTLSVKMVGLFTFGTVGLAVIWDLWCLLDIRRGLTIRHVFRHFMARAVGLLLVPAAVYLSFFWIHFQILNRSGTGDAFMSPEFQTTLKGNNLFTQSLPIKYGDNVTFLHKNLKVYLHSHVERYPLRYEDGRISTQGQQVTGYPYKDNNNYWRIHPSGPLDEEQGPVKNGDVIRLEHIITNSFLMTHDVASPSMPTNEEMTTIPANDTSKHKMTLFKVDLENQPAGTEWESHVHLVKILHVETPVAVWTHRKPLPDWGFNQNEINGNKKLGDSGNLWSVDEIMGVNHSTTEKPPTKRNFFLKFMELQYQMLAQNSQISSDHPFATRPWQWPFTHRGCSYWTRDASKEQIYLLGNPLGYWLGTIFAILFSVYLAVDQLFLRRGIDTLSLAFRRRVYNSGFFLLLAYLLHYLPFFPMGRQLFLHHYLPALIFKYLLLGAAFQYTLFPTVDPSFGIHSDLPIQPKIQLSRPIPTSLLAKFTAILLIFMQLGSFGYFAPLTYGTSLAGPGQVYSRKWLPSWDFNFAKPATADEIASIVPQPKPVDESPIPKVDSPSDTS